MLKPERREALLTLESALSYCDWRARDAVVQRDTEALDAYSCAGNLIYSVLARLQENGDHRER